MRKTHVKYSPKYSRLTRRDLRVQVRQRLADTGVDPRWDHDAVNRAIAEAIRRYSTRIPRSAELARVLPVGTWEVELPRHIDPLKIIWVVDDQGVSWRHWEPGQFVPCPLPYGVPGAIPCWRAWADAVILSQPTTRTGLWRVVYVASRDVPTNDDTPLDIEPGDAPILTAQTAAILLLRHAVAEGKKGRRTSSADPLIAAARSAQMEADALLSLRIRSNAVEPWPSEKIPKPKPLFGGPRRSRFSR